MRSPVRVKLCTVPWVKPVAVVLRLPDEAPKWTTPVDVRSVEKVIIAAVVPERLEFTFEVIGTGIEGIRIV
jgi:hypothetical protein